MGPRGRKLVIHATYHPRVRAPWHRWLVPLVSLALASVVATAPAEADTYCVSPAIGCDQTAFTIQEGLKLAAEHAGDDTVQLGAGKYVIKAEEPLTYSKSGLGTATLQGMGSTATTVEPDLALIKEALVGGAVGESGDLNVRAMHLHMTGVIDAYGVATEGTLFEDLKIDATGETDGVRLNVPGAVVRNSSFTQAEDSLCVEISPTSIASDTFALEGDTFINCAIQSSSGNILLEHDKLESPNGVTAGRGHLIVEDSLLRITGGYGVYAVGSSPEIVATVNQSTILGDGAIFGLRVVNSAGSTARLNVYDSIVQGFQHDVVSTGTVVAPPSVTGDYVDYDSATTEEASAGDVKITHPYANLAPQFVDSAGGDLSLAPASPLIDQDPTPLTVFESTTDLAGNPRFAGAGRDLGAYERQPPPAPGGGSGSGGGPATGAPGGGPTVKAIAPAISSLKLTPSRFHAASNGGTLIPLGKVAKRAVGARLSFTLSIPAVVSVTILKRVPGVRKSGRCLAPKPTHGGHQKRCARLVATGKRLTIKAVAGANALQFTGRVDGRRLRPGSYLLEARPAGGLSARVGFQVL
jgi:hypothetical protein